ncbi:MAG: imidazoleglycerol-phosphate dehydratase HisB [Phycisphaerae bacterium]|jgi:imidazoleglycerol-phosphate dehydratase
MSERKAKIERTTTETDIRIELNLDGSGTYSIDTGVGFLDHMLAHLSKHSGIDLQISAKGDYQIDDHHTVEDIAICLGNALTEALGDKRGICRYGSASVPMEDALANVAVDICGRPFIVYNVNYIRPKVGTFDVELVEEFLRSLANFAKINLHINVPYGTNSHHIAEAIFKSFGQALGNALKVSGSDIPSTKGVL